MRRKISRATAVFTAFILAVLVAAPTAAFAAPTGPDPSLATPATNNPASIDLNFIRDDGTPPGAAASTWNVYVDYDNPLIVSIDVTEDVTSSHTAGWLVDLKLYVDSIEVDQTVQDKWGISVLDGGVAVPFLDWYNDKVTADGFEFASTYIFLEIHPDPAAGITASNTGVTHTLSLEIAPDGPGTVGYPPIGWAPLTSAPLSFKVFPNPEPTDATSTLLWASTVSAYHNQYKDFTLDIVGNGLLNPATGFPYWAADLSLANSDGTPLDPTPAGWGLEVQNTGVWDGAPYAGRGMIDSSVGLGWNPYNTWYTALDGFSLMVVSGFGPLNLRLNPDSSIAPGTYTINVNVDSRNITIPAPAYTWGPFSKVIPISVTVASPFSATVAPTGYQGKSYSLDLKSAATDLPAGITYTTTDTLPLGLTLTPAGLISGNLTIVSASGSYPITVTATYADAKTVDKDITIVVASPFNTALATGSVGAAFAFDAGVSGVPATYSATGLPGWMSISPTGALSGIPTSSGYYVISVTADYGGGETFTSPLGIDISAAASPPTPPAPPSVAGAEKFENGGWYFYQTGSAQPVQGEVTLPDGRVVYYTDNGMQFGMVNIGGGVYHYYNLNNGRRLTGEQNVGGSWYYFDPAANGDRVTGEFTLPDGRVVYYTDNGMQFGMVNIGSGVYRYYNLGNGRKLTGEQNVSGRWYYFDPAANGDRVTGHFTLPDGRQVYYTYAGMQFGLVNVGGGVYRYYNVNNGRLYTGGELNVNGSWYYFDTISGNRFSGGEKYLALGSRTVYYAADGTMQFGEVTVGGVKHYYNLGNGNKLW